MPVINLPRDTRWGELGQGLGKLLEGAVTAYTDKKADEVVQQVVSDLNVSELDKGKQIFKLGGKKAYDRYKEYLGVDVIKAGIEGKRSETLKNLVTAGKPNAILEALGLGASSNAGAGTATAPTTSTVASPSAPTPTGDVAAVLEGQPAATASPAPAPTPTPTPTAAPMTAQVLGGTPAPVPTPGVPARLDAIMDSQAAARGVALTPAEKQNLIPAIRIAAQSGDPLKPITDFIDNKAKGATQASTVSKAASDAATAAAGATTAGAKAQVDLAKSQQELAELEVTAPYKGRQASANLRETEQRTAANTPAQIGVEEIKKSFPTFSDAQATAAATAAAEGGSKAYVEQVGKAVAQNAGAAVGESTAKFLRDTASYGAITERFANEMAAQPEKLGVLGGAGIKARLEAYGLPIGDPALLALLNSQKLAAADQARQNGQFGISATNLKLSRDTAANIDKTALSNVMMFAGAAAQKLKEGEVEKALYADNPRALAAIDAALQPWKNIQKMTDTLVSYAVKEDPANPRSKERDVMYFMGNQVSPNTMAPIVKQDSTVYKVKPQGDDKKTSYTGAELFALAIAAGTDPADMLRRMGGKP